MLPFPRQYKITFENLFMFRCKTLRRASDFLFALSLSLFLIFVCVVTCYQLNKEPSWVVFVVVGMI